MRHRREQGVHAAEAPEHRGWDQHPVLLAQVHALANRMAVFNVAPVGQLHRFGACRGARRKQQIGGVVRLHRGLGRIDCLIRHALALQQQIMPAQRVRRELVAPSHDLSQSGQGQTAVAHRLQGLGIVIAQVAVNHDQQRGAGAG